MSKRISRHCLIILFAVLLVGCKSVMPDGSLRVWKTTSTNSGAAGTNGPARDGVWHSVVVTPSPELPKVRLWDELNPVWWFENLDEPVPPAWYKPSDKLRRLKWRFRNPFHNFNSYVIGIADKTFVRSGRFPDKVGNPCGGWDFAVSKYRRLRLPFVSYTRRRFHFYFGWRERGNFGIKMNISGPKKPPAKPSAAHFTAPSESNAPAASGP